MNISKFFLCSIILLFSNCISSKNTSENTYPLDRIPVISISAEGNLESFNPIKECVEINEIERTHSPADILPAAKKCVDENRHELALKLNFIARLYAFYDMQRVIDGTAHQAILMLEEQAYNSLEEEDFNSLQQASVEYQNPESEKYYALCKQAKELGAPNYHPTYMIQHGLAALMNQEGNGLVEKFDSTKGWMEALSKVKCTEKAEPNTKVKTETNLVYEPNFIREGEGIGNLIFCESTMYDVIREYGTNFRSIEIEDQRNWYGPGTHPTVEGYPTVDALHYEDLGITFQPDEDTQIIRKVILEPPFSGKTSNGLTLDLGNTLMEAPFEFYTNLEWSTTGASDYWKLALPGEPNSLNNSPLSKHDIIFYVPKGEEPHYPLDKEEKRSQLIHYVTAEKFRCN